MRTQVTFTWSRVSHAEFYWTTNMGLCHKHKPKKPTVFGNEIDSKAIMPAVPVLDYPQETMLERAKRRMILDVWRPVIVIHLTANNVLKFTGDKAKALWREWNSRQYKARKEENSKA